MSAYVKSLVKKTDGWYIEGVQKNTKEVISVLLSKTDNIGLYSMVDAETQKPYNKFFLTKGDADANALAYNLGYTRVHIITTRMNLNDLKVSNTAKHFILLVPKEGRFTN